MNILINGQEIFPIRESWSVDEKDTHLVVFRAARTGNELSYTHWRDVMNKLLASGAYLIK